MFSLVKMGVDPSQIKTVVSLCFIMVALLVFIAFVLRIIKALGVYEMTKTLGIKSKWFAFFPIFSSLAFGKLGDCAKGRAITFFRKILLILNLLYLGIFIVGLFSFFLGTVDTVFAADKVLYKELEITKDVASALVLPTVILCISAAVYLIYRIFYYIALWRIFSAFVPGFAVAYIIFSVILPFLAPVFIFLIRKNKPFFRNNYQSNTGLGE